MLKITRILFYCILVLFLLDIYDIIQTKIDFFKVIIYYGILILPISLLVIEIYLNRSFRKHIIIKTILICTIIGLLYINPLNIIYNISTWKTQTVEYVDKNWMNHKVEIQMKDMGAFGYANRKVEIVYLSNYFYFICTKKFDDHNFTKYKWKMLNK